jgi:prevent-host-death family protein
MMETVGSFDAKTHLPQLLDRVARGEEFTITRHGKPVARLVPLHPAHAQPDVPAAVAAMKQFRKGRSLEGLNVRDMIEEGRRF